MRWTTARVPVLIGPQIPRADRSDTRERYCRAILTLFRPWHTIDDLCKVYEKWDDALKLHVNDLSESSKQIIENIELLHECKSGRDDNLTQMINEECSSDSHPTQYQQTIATTDCEAMEEDVHELLDLLEMRIEDATNKSSEESACNEEHTYIQNAISCVLETGRFAPIVEEGIKHDIHGTENCPDLTGLKSSTNSFYSVASSADIALNARWQISIKEAKKTLRDNILNGVEERRDSDHAISSADEAVTCMSEDVQIVIYSSEQISKEFRLNTEQNRAFILITDHLDGKTRTGTGTVLDTHHY
jgi:hypothetical protein